MENMNVEMDLWEIMVSLNRLKELDKIESAYFNDLIELNNKMIKMLDALMTSESPDGISQS